MASQQVVQSSQTSSSKTVVKQQSFSSSSSKTVSSKSSSFSSSSTTSSATSTSATSSIGGAGGLAIGAGGMEERMQQMLQSANGKGAGDSMAALTGSADEKMAAMMKNMGVAEGNGNVVSERHVKAESMKMERVNDQVAMEGKKHESLATSHGKGDFETNEEFKEAYDLSQGTAPIESSEKKQITTEPQSDQSNTKVKTAMTVQLAPEPVNQPLEGPQ